MPTYEYACKQCGEHLEVVQAFTDDSLTECPNCKGQLRKVFGSVGVSFKGSGFYKTDSRKAAAGATSSAKAGSESAGSAAPEASKPAPASSDSGSTSTPSSSDGGSKSSEKAAS